MIFVATNADASALNLGKISIKNIGDVSKETYDVITAYGNKSLTDDQIIALDDFLIAFNNASWKSKVKRLVIPVLGNDVDNPTSSSAGVEYANLYDIIKKEKGKLTTGGTNGDTGSPVITFKDGIYANAFANSANYVPSFIYTEIPYNVRDLMFGVYGKRGTHPNNEASNVILSIKSPVWACGLTPKTFEVGASTQKTTISTAETDKGEDFNAIFSYNYGSYFFKGYKDGVLVSVSTLKDTYANGETNNGFAFYQGDKAEKKIGNVIKIMTLGSSMTEQEMKQYDSLLRNLLSVL